MKKGDLVVVTAGVPVGVPGHHHMIKVHLVGGHCSTPWAWGRGAASGRLCVCRSPEEVKANSTPVTCW